MRLIVGITGATGAIYGIRLLEVLRDVNDVETQVIVSPSARQTIQLETDRSIAEIEALADVVYRYGDIAAGPSSGSHPIDAMVVIPCSMKTLASIAHSFSDSLLTRAADVMLKERRPLVLVPRETPLHLGHLRLLVQAAEIGAVIVPPMPAFYHRPTTLEEVVDQTVNRVLDALGIALPTDLFRRWNGADELRAANRDRPEPADGG
jgi:4-hydroxy-3-polyprenylbenzoate decarboxylase